jgi:hypothetical protein
VTQQEHDAAIRRGEESIRTQPGAIAVHFEPETRRITINLNRGFSVSFPPERAQGLANASNDELSEIEITSAGLGIYFPRLDADLSVPAIVNGRFGNDRWEAAWHDAHPQQLLPARKTRRKQVAA